MSISSKLYTLECAAYHVSIIPQYKWEREREPEKSNEKNNGEKPGARARQKTEVKRILAPSSLHTVGRRPALLGPTLGMAH